MRARWLSQQIPPLNFFDCKLSLFKMNIYKWCGEGHVRKQVALAVLPRRYAPMGPGSIPSPGTVCAFGFQSILTSAGFLWILWFSLLHLKLDFLNKSVSKHHIEVSLEFNAFALSGFAWFSGECYKYKYKKHCLQTFGKSLNLIP